MKWVLAAGWRELWRGSLSAPALALAAVPAVLGTLILAGLLKAGLAPMVLPMAGGFLLVGPAAWPLFLALRRCGSLHGATWVLRGMPRGLWALAGVCLLLFLIWMSDAATVYSFMIGGETGIGGARVAWFLLLTSVMGVVLALIVFCIAVFSVPLLLDRRAGLVQAVMASVKAVFASPGTMLLWAGVLGVTGIVSALCPLLLLPALPWLAFAGDLLYLEIFPPDHGLPDVPTTHQD
ncbi:DUF2189 domain-containing protein [Zoogloea dura]|uniref:DUF2189 domain-containing protein n=1 Tax=Zoogloea dura TaxID=2728840 RepID=UPI00145E1C28|nr:DUF2189 domain-containing protein [Zoogloea dura]